MTTKQRRGGARPAHDLDVAAKFGNGDRHLEADGVAMATFDGVPVFVPERVRRNATAAQREALAAVARTTALHMTVLAELADQVGAARELGLSWETIGWVTGLTSAGARKRWGSGV